ncbi:MAG: serine/threonine protein kinase [Pirellulaceae bacterium]
MVQRLLGTGGFGTVYLAHDGLLKRLVALKVPHRPAEECTDALAEARVAASLRHPGIVTVYDVIQTSDGRPCIVSEYIDGQTLAQLLKSQGKLGTRQVAEMMAKVARALHHAHKLGFVHRDIKPGNVLVRRDGEPFVSDFGLALHEDYQEELRGDVAGTFCYMAPEQIEGRVHHFDGRTDAWAFGCVLYEMLTQRRPFQAEGIRLRDEICERNPKPLRQRDDTIPRALEDICLRCLSKNIADRYPTMMDVAVALEEWLAQTPVSSAMQSLPRTPRRAAHRWWWAASAGTVVISLAAAAIGLMPRRDSSDYSTPIEYRIRPGRWHDLPLLGVQPREVAFTANKERGRWLFLTDTHSLLLDSREPGLVGLGTTEAGRYRFQVQMSKSEWGPSGQCGVFLGLKPAKLENGRDGFVYHSVHLHITADGRSSIALGRMSLWFTVSGDHLINSEQLAGCPVKVDPLQDVLLDVEVTQGRIVSVRFHGNKLPELTDLAPEVREKLANCTGEFGVWNSRSPTRFANCQVVLH